MVFWVARVFCHYFFLPATETFQRTRGVCRNTETGLKLTETDHALLQRVQALS